MTIPTEVEQRAVELAYERDHNSPLQFSEISPYEQDRLLAEIRQRAAKIEQSLVSDLLMPKMKHVGKKQHIASTAVLMIVAVIVVLSLAIYQLIHHFH